MPTPTEQRRQSQFSGRLAEYAAAGLLMAKGYRILAMRWRCKLGEIDLIVARANRLAFVEVKRRNSLEAAHAAISALQSHRIHGAADLWLQANPRYHNHEIAFDIVFVVRGRWPQHIEHSL